jgi:hypothetical protein
MNGCPVKRNERACWGILTLAPSALDSQAWERADDAVVLHPAQGEGRAPVNALVTQGVGWAAGGAADDRVFVEEFGGGGVAAGRFARIRGILRVSGISSWMTLYSCTTASKR